MKYPLSALALAAACALPLIVSAQAKPTEIYVSVVDAKGNPAAGLTADDFRVREDGVAREVLKAGAATEPLSVALVVDDSQATQPATQMIREAMDEFIKAIDGKAEIALVTFGDRPTIVVDYTTDQKKLRDGAKRVFPRSDAGGNLLDTLVEVSKGMQKREAKRPIIAVLMMDNSIEFSNRYYEQVLDEIGKARTTLHVVALGQPSDQPDRRAAQIATGHRDRHRADRRPPRPVMAPDRGDRPQKLLAQELLNQYVVTYARPRHAHSAPEDRGDRDEAGLKARARTRTGLAGCEMNRPRWALLSRPRRRPRSPPRGQRIRSGVELVSLSVTATDGQGKYATDLNERVRGLRGRRKQKLTFFSKTQQPISLALLLDTSASMDERMGIAQEAAIGFAKQLHKEDQAEVIDFDSQVRVLVAGSRTTRPRSKKRSARRRPTAPPRSTTRSTSR
jgi:hypothetical protein